MNHKHDENKEQTKQMKIEPKLTWLESAIQNEL